MTDQLALPLHSKTLSNSQHFHLQGLMEWIESIPRGTQIEGRKASLLGLLSPLIDLIGQEYSPIEAFRAGWALANDAERDDIAVNIMGLRIDPTRSHGTPGRYLDDGERSEAALRNEPFKKVKLHPSGGVTAKA